MVLALGLRAALFSFFLSIFLVSAASASNGHDGGDKHLQTYVVLVEKPEHVGFASAGERRDWHESFLSRATAEGTAAKSRMVYSYGDVVSGFAARLSFAELKAMQEMEGFVAAFPDRVLPLLTTHSPGFLGLSLANGQWSNSRSGEGVIIGMLDTGATSNHPSFSGAGMPPPPPAKWKGRCEVNEADCNNKLIGYKVFNLGVQQYSSGHAPRRVADTDGHGTHTASTAAGAPVEGVSVLGYANGTAVGMAPRAHLAIYEVCSDEGCSYADLMAGVDAAVEDGVDVLSISLGGISTPFYEDGLAVSAFRAMEKGVLVSCAAGNSGPFSRTLSNEAPWMLTVAASTIDRSLRTTVRLGDGQELDGESMFQPPRGADMTDLPLVYPRGDGRYSFCGVKQLSHFDVKGKVVICDRGGLTTRTSKAENIRRAGGAGMILANLRLDGYSTVADVYPIPTANLGFSDGSKVKAYVNASRNPTVSIVVRGTVIGTSPSPVISSFSSRGPSTVSRGILKPDVTGPGVDIVAAWPFHVDRSDGAAKVHFNVLSGTSMSTPHLSGVAALVKSAHPDWSPAAIKSAIMTTSDVRDREGRPIMNEKLHAASLFAMGAGHVNPSRAEDPGLVYDLQPDDYIAYLCRLRYTDANVTAVVGRRVRCSDRKEAMKADLNYPSISVSLGSGVSSVAVRRTVTNVGEASSVYTVKVEQLAGVGVTVSPETLRFSMMNQKISFTVSFSRDVPGVKGFAEGHLLCVSDKHVVRSPISVSIS